MNLSGIEYRLKGFTILELLVGMIATSIVIAAIFSAYHIISTQALTFEAKTQLTTNLSSFHSRITKDFHEASIITWIEEGFVLRESSYNQNDRNGVSLHLPLKYEFHDGYTLRKSGEHIDTFFVNVRSHQLFGNGVLLTDSIGNSDEIRIVTGDESEEMILRKSIDAKTALLGPSQEWMK